MKNYWLSEIDRRNLEKKLNALYVGKVVHLDEKWLNENVPGWNKYYIQFNYAHQNIVESVEVVLNK